MREYGQAHQFLKTLETIECGSIMLTTPELKVYNFQGQNPGAHCNIFIHDWRTVSALATKGDIGLAEAYRDGWWDADDLTNVFLVAIENEHALKSFFYGSAIIRLATNFLYFFTRNTLKGSRRNIQAHYDLGNEFYKLWLDPSMSYSAALFKDKNDDLEKAQYNKYDRMLERLDTPSGRLLEVGCGWGGFAERAIHKYDYDLKGITLSEEQHAYTNTRLKGDAKIVIEDYRAQTGRYDNIISIEMFEAVGEKFWPTYFSKMKSLLNQKGKAVIQTITIDEKHFKRYRRGGDMIRSFIFPGGMLPSPSRFKKEAERAGLKVTDTFAFGQDYARTLQHWSKSFETKEAEVKALGFDEPFVRMWRLYLSICNAGFLTGRTDVMQLELQHA